MPNQTFQFQVVQWHVLMAYLLIAKIYIYIFYDFYTEGIF